MIKLMAICNNPALSNKLTSLGVDRIFVDLEIIGKKERQLNRNTFITDHCMEDIGRVRSSIKSGDLLVRVNPFHQGTKAEIDAAIKAGADIIMLPMFKTAKELDAVIKFINARVRFIPLIETINAVQIIDKIVNMGGVDEVFIGLNDLHIAYSKKFMFELLIDGTIQRLADVCNEVALPFGFGGIATMADGELPGWLVLAEHKRMGSNSVILSRTFFRKTNDNNDNQAIDQLSNRINELRAFEARLEERNNQQIIEDRENLVRKVISYVGL